MAIRAFLSFVEEDLTLVNLFRGQATAEKSELEFADCSIKEPFESTNAEYIRRGIADQLKPATLTICLYGPTTYTSQWVTWELNKALELKKPLMGVALQRWQDQILPSSSRTLAKSWLEYSADR